MIYLDASALVTLVAEQAHTRELRLFLDEHPHERTYSNSVGFVEAVRTCNRVGDFPNLMARLVRDHGELTMTDAVRDAASSMPGRWRSAVAIHVASAEQLGAELTALVTYDSRLAEAARKAGLPVAMPGVE